MTETNESLLALRAELRVIADLESAAAVLDWDQSTYMPDGGATARARQLALLSTLAHERLVSPRVRELLTSVTPLAEREDHEGAFVRRALRDHERAARVPSALVREMREHQAASYVAWTKARPANDFASMRPLLERSVEQGRRLSACHPAGDHVLDALIEDSDPGMTTATTTALFDELRAVLTPLVAEIASRPGPDVSILHRPVSKERQLAFGRRIVEAMGYDFARGRQDETHHPFMTRFSSGDVRITTRVKENDPTEALFSTVHEAGHALYELGIDEAFDASPLGRGTSTGVHESQSRLWENVVGRSRPFWECFLAPMREAYGGAYDDVSLDAWLRAINEVRPSLIRTDADEVTYNLHVMLRFSLERSLLEGSLAVKDLPDAWNERMRTDLGVAPSDDRDGVLQDVHWYAGTLGGSFQGYTLGNLLAAQLFEAFRASAPSFDDGLRRGNLAPLREWLGENVHRHGAALTPDELVLRATGRPLGVDAFARYLRAKYTELYGLSV